jgi:hypothetical protein
MIDIVLHRADLPRYQQQGQNGKGGQPLKHGSSSTQDFHLGLLGSVIAHIQTSSDLTS